MRRLPALPLVLALLAAACGVEAPGPPSPTPSPPGVSPATPASPTPAGPSPSPAGPSPTPTAVSRPEAPPWATPIDQPLPAADIAPERLVPPGAEATDLTVLPAAGGVPEQVVVAWSRGADPFARAHGLAVWQRFPEPPAWSVVYAFRDGPGDGVLGLRIEATGDLTGDAHLDVLSREDLGGSGACAVWRVVAAGPEGTRQVYREQTCDARVEIGDGVLVVTEAVFGPDDPHCCPSAFRTTTLRWDRQGWTVVGRTVEPA